MNKIKEIRGDGRIAIVEGGVILSTLHEAVAEYFRKDSFFAVHQ